MLTIDVNGLSAQNAFRQEQLICRWIAVTKTVVKAAVPALVELIIYSDANVFKLYPVNLTNISN